MTDTTAQIESEIEARRAGVEQTLDRLKGRLSFDQVVDDVGSFLGMDNAHEFVRVAGRKLGERPIALGLIGAGLLWLAVGGDDRTGSSSSSSRTQDRARRSSGAGYRTDNWREDEEGGSGVIGQTLADVSDRAQDLAGRAKSVAQDTANKVREISDPVATELNNHPLMFGAGAIVVGALIGSALPVTESEERLIAPRSKALLSEMRNASKDLGEQATKVAKAGYQTALKSAKREGLVPDDNTTLAEKIERVAEETVDEIRTQISSDPVQTPADAKGKAGAGSPMKGRVG